MTRRTRHGVAIAVISAVMLLLHGTPAWAQSSKLKNFELCNGVGSISLDLQISGCTALIASGALVSQGLVVAHNIRGNAYLKKNEYDRAIQDFDESVRINPNYAKAFNNRGVAHQRKGEYERAIENFDEAIRLDSDYAIAFANRANAHQKTGEYGRAAQDYSEVIRLQPRYDQLMRLQPELQSEWKRTLETVWNERCWTRAIIGELQAALADCDEALRIQPNVAAVFDSRGFTHLKMGQWDTAVTDYNSALRLEPKLASSLYGRGLARLKKGDISGGNADIRAAIAIKENIVADFARYGVK